MGDKMAGIEEFDDLVQKTVDLVDRKRLIDLTVALTDIASPTGAEAEISYAYLDMLKRAGLKTTLQPIGDDRFNAVGRLDGTGGGKSLLFNGHMDTSFGNDFADRGPGFRTKGTIVDDEWIFGFGYNTIL